MSVRPVKATRRSPASLEAAEKRAANIQNRIADVITRFAGSMWFVYLSAIWFFCWIVFRVEKYPFGLLTMIVSLEAIFLSTFVMISQNRADEKREILSQHEWEFVQQEEKQNEQLLQLSNEILELTRVIHQLTVTHTGGEPPPAPGPDPKAP
ncbi:MAG TPA: DUF1003 domain-containing protein [Actinomycetota bacterium]|nr:DUF1003 domain-containing protein [Actinomycetota bacterium]